MDALFIIPALISPNVNDKIVPAIAKMVERNTLLMYSSQIRSAALRRYANIFKTATSESILADIDKLITINESQKSNPPGWNAYFGGDTRNRQAQQPGFMDAINASVSGEMKKQDWSKSISNVVGSGATSGEGDGKAGLSQMVDKTHIEVPKGIHFYNSVSLEPTYLEIPVEMKVDVLGIGGRSDRIIRIGMKCIPYKLEGVEDIKNAIEESKVRHIIQGYFSRQFERIAKKYLPSRWAVFSGKSSTGDHIKDMIMGPSSEDLADPGTLKQLMDPRHSSKWSTLTVFSTYDFEDTELKDNLMRYRDMVKGGWGDMVVINEPRESIHFCTQKMLACYEMQFSYLKQVMNLDNVLDYREISRWTKPFHSVRPLKSVFEMATCPACEEKFKKNQLIDRINNIIKG